MEDWNNEGSWDNYKPVPGVSSAKDQSWGIKELEAQRNCEGLLAFLDLGYPNATRRSAAKALLAVARINSVPALVAALLLESDRAVRLNLLKTLGRLGDDIAIPVLIQTFRDKEALIRVEAAEALSRYNSETAFEALREGLGLGNTKEDFLVRQYSAEALGKLGDRRSLESLLIALKDENEFVRAAAATALGKLGDKKAVEALTRARHTEPHSPGSDCAECKAIDQALLKLRPPKNNS